MSHFATLSEGWMGVSRMREIPTMEVAMETKAIIMATGSTSDF